MSRRESWEEAEEKDVEYLEEARAVSSSIGGERPIPGTGSAHAGALKKPRMSLKLACVPPAAWSVQASSEADKDVCADSRAIGAIGATEATDDFSLDSYTPQVCTPLRDLCFADALAEDTSHCRNRSSIDAQTHRPSPSSRLR